MNTRMDALEEKTEQLSEGIKQTVRDFEVQSNNNMEQLRKNILANFKKMIWSQDYEANAHGLEVNETEAETNTQWRRTKKI